MIKKVLLLLTIFFILLSSLSIIKIDNRAKVSIINKNIILNSFNKKNDDIIGYIEIKSIKIKENLYKIDSPENNVDKNITILKESAIPPDNINPIFIAAHSGTGPKAYFKNLDKLKIDDEIIIYLYNKKYIYKIYNIRNEQKTGYIHISKDNYLDLIITTCNPHNNNQQLIISCTRKES